MTDRVTASQRLTLRPFATEDDGRLADWLPEAWAAVDARKPDGDEPSTVAMLHAMLDARWPGARLAAVEVRNVGVSGFVIWREERSEAGAIAAIRALAMRRDRRNLGYGVEAVDCLEQNLSGRRLAAPIPRWNGLAVYFWLRAGFRPFRADEDVERTRDPAHMWMIRAERVPLTDATADP